MSHVLEIQHLTKSFGQLKAVDDLSLTIDAGQAVAFIGQNGAGKSTTMRSIAGLSPIDSGHIFISGFDIHQEPVKARQHIGYVPQDLALHRYMTGNEYLSLVGKIRGLENESLTKSMDELFDLCDLQKARNKMIREYSGGMARKIAMAGALMGTPDLIVLDESFVGLDPESTYKISAYLQQFRSKGGAILISSHILEMLQNMCTRFFILHHGKCVADHSLQELQEIYQNPNTPNLTAFYLNKTDQQDLIQAFKG